ncbi:Blue copper oxidase CueO precursor [Candidatus Rhodobacter oscarellae]|uniref:Blue copper oxidase CueO n=1 Tax=Candidatus Rhodobacter oscarellae TaxID=1675527 RepID=A0A0J9E779_9RHOB|nr:multicopper oxidase family protein [Candidatus Rhodobacter lobularis]KMW58571.1 Blue copper oxidase CueO precursor [Candidatus Rhodobacter lobularis]
MTKDVTRRDFLSRSGSLLAAGTAAATLAADKAQAATQDAPAAPAEPYSGSTNDYTLTSDWKVVESFGADASVSETGVTAKLRAWNDSVPGPLLTSEPGNLLNIKVVNNLTAYNVEPYVSKTNPLFQWDGNHNVPHGLSATNLHVHGLEVIPHLFEGGEGTTDPTADMIQIPPEGGTRDYTFQLPNDQPPGLFWYHPHKHGSTVVQAVSGMAGGILIKGDIDEVPEIKAAADNILVVQDIGLFQTDNPDRDGADTWIYEPVQNTIWQTFSAGQVTVFNPATGQKENTDFKGGFTTGDYAIRYFLVNGTPIFKETHNPANPTAPTGKALSGNIPNYTMKQGEVARFRILNANSDDVMPLYLQGHDLYLIGMDGVNLPKLKTINAVPATASETEYQILIAPANRTEFLVKAANLPGTYDLVQAPQSLQFLESDRRVIATITITDETNDMDLPSALPVQKRHFPLTPDSDVIRKRYVNFGMQFPGMANEVVGIDFLINNQLYDERGVPFVVDLGTTEDWVLGSPGHVMSPPAGSMPGHMNNTEGHPFHIHVNSFEVIAEADVAPDGTVTNYVRYPDDQVLIQDTVWVPMGKQITIRNTFKEWAGKSVYHCHILPHEDTGMMQNFLILDGSDSHSDHG